MKIALTQARRGLYSERREVPVGAIVVDEAGAVIARTHNIVEARHNALMHAEVIALGRAMRRLGEKYLMNCTMYVTLEPCPMCMTAISLAKLGRLVYGASDENGGGMFVLERQHFFCPQIVGGVCEEEASMLLKNFFKTLRA
ncbi:MAG: nucleoside deaminase [Rickettsiales bacterium]|nr:nucleoside deaminase [Rickettsiales bacterium]